MARLRYKNQTPPRGYVYVEPSTRLRIEAENYGALIKKVTEHRNYRGLARQSREEIEQDVERQICTRLSPRECTPEGIVDEMRPVTETAVLTLGNVMKFSKAAIDWLTSGAEVVPIEQLKKRQKACLDCPLNQRLKACSCSIFYKTVNALVPAHRSDPNLYICNACGCSIPAKTQMPLSMIEKADEGRDIQFPAACWVSQEKAEKT